MPRSAGGSRLTQGALLGKLGTASITGRGSIVPVDAGTFGLLVTFGGQRTKRWPGVPTAKDLGLGRLAK